MTRHRLSPHFTIEEFDCRDGTRVPAAAVPNLEHVCRHWLEPLRGRFGPVSVHSGYRTPAYNISVGGARQSFHIYTLRGGRYPAADISCARGSVRDWWTFLDGRQREQHEPHGGLGFYPRGGFVHVDGRPYLARWDGP